MFTLDLQMPLYMTPEGIPWQSFRQNSEVFSIYTKALPVK